MPYQSMSKETKNPESSGLTYEPVWGAIRESNPFMSGSQPDVFTVSPIAPAGILYTSPYPPSRPNLALDRLFPQVMREAGKGEAEEGQFPSLHQHGNAKLRHSRVAFLDFLWGEQAGFLYVEVAL